MAQQAEDKSEENSLGKRATAANKVRLPYEPPLIESESIIEQNALACGKCKTVSHRQHACFRLPSTS